MLFEKFEASHILYFSKMCRKEKSLERGVVNSPVCRRKGLKIDKYVLE